MTAHEGVRRLSRRAPAIRIGTGLTNAASPLKNPYNSRRGRIHGASTWFRVGFRRPCRRFRADVKGLASYPLPWWGLTASATLQNRPSPQILARCTVTSAQVQNLNRPLGVGTAATQLIAPGTIYGDRVTQMDVRIGKMFRTPRGRVLASVDIFNALNPSAILSLNTTYGTSWLSSTRDWPATFCRRQQW